MLRLPPRTAQRRGVTPSSTLTFTSQHTYDDIQAAGFDESAAEAYDLTAISGASAAAEGFYTQAPVAVRLEVTAFTDGSATYNVIQSGGR